MEVYCVTVWESGEMETEVWCVFKDKDKAFAYAEELRNTDWLIKNNAVINVSGHTLTE